MRKLGKKGVLDQLGGLVQVLVFLGILLAVTFLIVAEIAANDQVIADANASAAVDEVQNAMSDVPQWLPI